jgi:MOSC domain-containing protein YiiM
MKLNPQSPLATLLDTFPRAGKLEWIGLRPAPRGAVQAVNRVEVLAGLGLAGDHKACHAGGDRQVTLIQHEHLAAVAALLARAAVPPELARRNLVVSGVNLLALRDRRFTIGDVLLEGTGPCDPCSRMEANLGPGGLNAMRGHGGITARVLKGGVIALGDPVRFAPEPPAEQLSPRVVQPDQEGRGPTR